MGLVLEKEMVDSPDALSQCVTKAWEEACSGRQTMGLAPPSQDGTNGGNEKSDSVHAFNTLLGFEVIAEIAASLSGATTESRPTGLTLLQSAR